MRLHGGRHLRIFVIMVLFSALVIFAPLLSFTSWHRSTYGVTFSPRYARYLGLSSTEAYGAMLTELRPQFVRLPVYWSDVEVRDNTFDFSDIDVFVDEARAHNVPVTLAVGYKVPRWPECYVPAWVGSDDAEQLRAQLFAYLEEVVTRYRGRISVWQVENEYLFPYGECPAPDLALWRDEIAFIRALDPSAKIQLTVSGEQQPWTVAAAPADIVGASLYRQVDAPATGLIQFPIPPAWYGAWAESVSPAAQPIISELQAEPWFMDDPKVYTLADAYELFTTQDLLRNVRFAERTGMDTFGFWGVEWWYYLRVHGDDRLWRAAQGVMTRE